MNTTPTIFRKTNLGWPSWQALLPFLTLVFMAVASQSALAQRFTSDSLTVAYSTTGASSTNQIYYGKGGTPIFGGASGGGAIATGIDPFNAAGTLTITAIGNRLNPSGTTTVNSSFYYRVYLQGSPAANVPTYTKVSLSGNSSNSSVKAIYGSNQVVDLLTVPRNTGGGTYVVDLYYDFNWQDGSDSGTVNDKASGPSTPYSATFTVIAPATTPVGATTTWQSTSSTEWTNQANWTNGVPNRLSDVIIPEKTTGFVYPILGDSTYNYAVRNITLVGNTNSGRALLTINQATLRVYGNLRQPSGGFSATVTRAAGVVDSTKNSTVIFAGADQIITGRLSIPDIIIAGTGIKSVINTLLPTNTLSFRPASVSNGVLLQSASEDQGTNGSTVVNFNTTGNSIINLSNSGVISTVPGQSETTTSYVLGVMTADNQLVTGVKQVFGNIGLDFVPNHNTSASVLITRIIGDPLIGPVVPNPRVKPVPIKRQYQIKNDDDSNASSFSNSSNMVTFHYLPSAFELNGIAQKNLALFRTIDGGAPYTPLSGVLDSTRSVVIKDVLPSLAQYTLTLGDRTNPLPVSLTAFTAVRSSNDVLLNWTTASEKNNTGFEVQVSTDGATFRKLTFVATQNANSTQKLTYSYTDTEIGKTGVRYYRLRQIDQDNTAAFSPVRAVSFSGAAVAATALTGYPNPFTSKIDFNLDATAVGDGVAHVQLVDMTGRIVREQDLRVANASLTLNDLDGLRSGLYLAKVTLPDGTTQKVRVQKQ